MLDSDPNGCEPLASNRLQPSGPLYWIGVLGHIGLYLFAFCLLLSTSLATLGFALMAAAFFCQLPQYWRIVQRDPIFRLGLLFLAYVSFRMLLAISRQPPDAAAQLDAAWAWFSLWGFVMVSWWAGSRPQQIYQALFLALLGFLLRIAYDLVFEVHPSDIRLFFQGIRTGLHYSVNAAGLYTATAIWGLLLTARRFFQIKSAVVFRESGFLIWIVSLTVMLNFCFITQSLSALYSLAAVFTVMLPAIWIVSRKDRMRVSSKKGAAAAACLLAAISLIGYLYGHTILHRTSVESDTLVSILGEGKKKMPKSALGLRLAMWQLGLDKFTRKPIAGWGPGTSVIQRFAEDEGYRTIRHYPHLHNTYLVVLVRLGLAGALFYLLGAFFFLRALIRTCRLQLMPRRLLFFFSGAFLLILISSMASFHVTDVDFRFYWLLLAGLAYSPHFSPFRLKGFPPAP
jgi:O-antigen ligase